MLILKRLFPEKSDFSVQPLRSLCLCGCFSWAIFNHRGTENAEIAQRRACVTTFRAKPPEDLKDLKNLVNPV
jgi:hypothetical protein